MLTTQVLTFTSTESEQFVTIPIIDDTFFEFQEHFFGELTQLPVEVNVILSPDEVTVLVNDNDGMFEVYLVSVCSYQLYRECCTRLLFKFRSGTNGLNEELGRHRGKNDDRQCKLCRGECESVVHVLWECPAYDSIRNNFMVELENLLGGRFGEFSTLDNFNKASFILGFENWNRDDFKALLKLVKSFVLLIWETRKKELYGDQDCVVSGCSCSCPLTGGLTSSACVCGCVVNGVSATAAT